MPIVPATQATWNRDMLVRLLLFVLVLVWSHGVLPAARLDRVSTGCLGCHDGAGAQEVPTGSSPASSLHHWPSAGHPVGVRYAEYTARDPGAYRAPQALDGSIRLVDGRVSCISCHTPRATEQVRRVTLGEAYATGCTASGELAADPLRGGLCLGCHLY